MGHGPHGVEDGRFFDRCPRCLSFSRMIGPVTSNLYSFVFRVRGLGNCMYLLGPHPQCLSIQKRQKRGYLFTFNAHFSSGHHTSCLSVLSSISVCFLHPCSLVFRQSFQVSQIKKQISFFFRSVPLVQGSNPDTLSRIRFSVFLRTESDRFGLTAAAAA